MVNLAGKALFYLHTYLQWLYSFSLVTVTGSNVKSYLRVLVL